MGQFGPTFAANKGIRRFSDSGFYVLGVLVSSTVFVFAVDAAGAGSHRQPAAGAPSWPRSPRWAS